MLKKKNKIFLKKQIKKLWIYKHFNFKLENNLGYINLFNILNNYSILLFSQFISLKSEIDLKFYLMLFDKQIFSIFLKKKYLNKIFSKKKKLYLKNFNNIIGLTNLNMIEKLEIFFKEKKILILGYYFNKIFFIKKI